MLLSRIVRGVCCVLLCVVAAPVAQAKRQVFAHYMLANRDYAPGDATGELDIAAYQREIRQAQAIGIDGFALNAGGWFREPRYIRRAAEMFEAAVRLRTGFVLFFSADMCCGNDAADVEDMVRRFANNPRYAGVYFSDHGKSLVTTFAGESRGVAFWRAVRADIEHGTHPSTREAPCEGSLCVPAGARGAPANGPLPIIFVPSFFFGGELPGPVDVSGGVSAYREVLDGAFYWGIAGVPGLGHAPDQLPSSAAYASALHDAGKLYMAPVALQFWGANAGRYYEYSGYAGMRAMWMNAINVTHPEWVEIITWNDFVEGTYVSPIDEPIYDRDPRVRATVHSHAGASQLLAYFIAWYKSGREPVIDRDGVYWAYRTGTALEASLAGIKRYGPVADVVYVTANLRAPATLKVSFGGRVISKELRAGSSDVQVPAVAGFAPRFELIRGSKPVTEGAGVDVISGSGESLDLYYSTGFMVSQK
jgi:glucan endo-1,3-alpha-glucosidase